MLILTTNWISHRRELHAAHAVLEFILGIRLINLIILFMFIFYALISVLALLFVSRFNENLYSPYNGSIINEYCKKINNQFRQHVLTEQ